MSDFNAKQAVFEIKQLFQRLMIGEIIELMDRAGLPALTKSGRFREDYLPKRLSQASAHQLASLKAIATTRISDGQALRSTQSRKFTVFLSHAAGDTALARDIGENLEFGGITSFAGRGDDQLDMENLEAIVTHLDAADVLLALNSNCSIKSAVCNQEIGFALGREIPVISLNDTAASVGLAAPLPSLDKTEFESDKNAALRIIDAMLQYPQLGPKLTDTLVETLVSCSSPADSFKVIGFCRKALAFSKFMTAAQLYELRKAARENNQIARFASGRGPELIESMCLAFEERFALTG